jgi:SAM-dependent methyltransferase
VFRSIRRVLRGDSGVDWLQPLPKTAPVDRRAFIVELCRGKRVIHLGFTDERLTRAKQSKGRWLHAALADSASELVGLDVDADGIEEAVRGGYDAHVVDLQDAAAVAALGLAPGDVLVAGEIIEHLDAPGPFLRAIRPLVRTDGVLIVTTPNAYRMSSFLAPALGAELNHPDHLAIHSIHTLRTLGERSGFRAVELGYYQNNPTIPITSAGALVVKSIRSVQTFLLRLGPHWSDGIYAVFAPGVARGR